MAIDVEDGRVRVGSGVGPDGVAHRENIGDILNDLMEAGLSRCDVVDLVRRLSRWAGATPVCGTHVWDGQHSLYAESAGRTLGQLCRDLDDAALDLDLLPDGTRQCRDYGDDSLMA